MENISQSRLMWNDIIKFITVIVIVHLLFYCVDDYGGFMNESILKILLYTTISIIIYYLVITKLINRYLFTNQQTAATNATAATAATEIAQKENFEKTPTKSIIKKDRIRKRNNKKVRFKE